jgi:hypothetical protein
MKPTLNFSILILITGAILYFSCQKELSCYECKVNKPPISNAGNDTSIVLPADSIWLDGSLSTDPDDGIANYEWKKIFGPDTFYIDKNNSVKTTANKLRKATYRFELTVTDKGGLSAKDTMQVTVSSFAISNRPPVANAGKDTSIELPANSIMLDGRGSTDPNNNIVSYVWTKISGPASFTISNLNIAQTLVTNLVQGTYEFELTVTDAGGLLSKDTLQLVIHSELATGCVTGNRQHINVQVTPFGTLSVARSSIAVASAGNKILFAGGNISTGAAVPTSRVDIYDIVSKRWSIAELSAPRYMLSAISCSNKVLLTSKYSDDQPGNVDIYDASTNTWSVTKLPERRYLFSIAAAGNKVFFAGGETPDGSRGSNRVDIYNVSTNVWTTSFLSEGRWHMNAVTTNDKIYFAGGYSGSAIDDTVHLSNRIDIYDNTTETWDTSSFRGLNWAGGSIAVANNIYWTGGTGINPDHGGGPGIKNMVEIRDPDTRSTLFDCLSQPKGFLSAVQKDNNIIFFSPYTQGSLNNWFDLYNISTNTWSIGVFSQNIYSSSDIISVNNTIYLAGGNPSGVLSNQVWKLEF